MTNHAQRADAEAGRTLLVPLPVQCFPTEFMHDDRFERPAAQPHPQKRHTRDRVQGRAAQRRAPAFQNLDHFCGRDRGAAGGLAQLPCCRRQLRCGIDQQNPLRHAQLHESGLPPLTDPLSRLRKGRG